MNFKYFLNKRLYESFENDKISFSQDDLIKFAKYNEIPNNDYMLSLYYAYECFDKKDPNEFEKRVKDIVSQITHENGYESYIIKSHKDLLKDLPEFISDLKKLSAHDLKNKWEKRVSAEYDYVLKIDSLRDSFTTSTGRIGKTNVADQRQGVIASTFIDELFVFLPKRVKLLKNDTTFLILYKNAPYDILVLKDYAALSDKESYFEMMRKLSFDTSLPGFMKPAKARTKAKIYIGYEIIEAEKF